MKTLAASVKASSSWPFWAPSLLVSLLALLISWSWADIAFTLICLVSLWQIFEGREKSEIKSIALRGKLPLSLTFAWLLSTIIGYWTASPMNAEQWDEILGFRWLLAFFACVYAGNRLPLLSNKAIDRASLLFSFLMLLGLLWQYFHPTHTNTYGGIERLHAFYTNPNNFALSLVVPWAFLVGWNAERLRQEKTLSMKSLIVIAILSLALYASFTRSAWVGMVAVAFVLLGIYRNRKVLFLFLTAVCALILMFTFDIFSFKDRVMYSFMVAPGNSSALRLQIWKVNWHIFLDHPIFGVGFYENIRMVLPYYKKLGMEGETFVAHAHNQFLQVLASSGIVGFFFYCSTFVVGCYYFYRKFKASRNESIRKMALGGLLSLIAFLFSGLTESPLMLHEPRSFLLFFAGVCTGYMLKEAPQPTEEGA